MRWLYTMSLVALVATGCRRTNRCEDGTRFD